MEFEPGSLFLATADGRVPVAGRCQALRDDAGAVVGAVAVFRAARVRQVQPAQAVWGWNEVEELLRRARVGIDVIDAEFNLQYVNEGWREVYGDPTGRKCYEYFQGRREPCPGCAILRALERRQPAVSEETLPREGDRVVEVHTVPFQDAAGRWLVAEINLDVTSRKRIEQELRAANEQLEQAIARANRLVVQAEMASVAKSEFLANASHELRTPLTAILGFAETLLEGCPGHCAFGAKEHREQAYTIVRSGQHLLKLLDDILDLSKIEAGKLTLEPVACALPDLVAELQSVMQARAAAKGLRLRTVFEGPIPERILTDPTRLRQILMNLLGNAVKFTELGEVTLATRLGRLPDGSPAMEFDVADTGIGLSDDQAERIFEPFVQADASASRRFGGTGLGLAIARRLARALGGDVELVESRLGVGSRFRVRVPAGPLDGVPLIERPEQATRARRSTAPGDRVEIPRLDGLHILLAEDGPDNQRLIGHLLRRAGAQVTVVENGRRAVEVILAAEYGRRQTDPRPPFDVVLMDMQMPVMDGYAAVRALRQRKYCRPIIALTAHAMASDRQKCLDAGCDEFATKPIDRAQLIALIRRQVDEHRARHGAAAEATGLAGDMPRLAAACRSAMEGCASTAHGAGSGAAPASEDASF